MSIIGQVLPKWALPVTVAAILIAVGVGAFSYRESAKVKYAEAQAKVDQHKAAQDAKVAEALDKQNADQAATTKADDAKAPDVAQKVAQARAAVARAQAPAPPPPDTPRRAAAGHSASGHLRTGSRAGRSKSAGEGSGRRNYP